MKKTNLWKMLCMSALMLTAGAMTSCDDNTSDEFQAEISASVSSVTVEAGDVVEFTVTSNASWTAEIDDDNNIIQALSKTSGKSGNTTVTATISPNAANRQKATVTFTAKSYDEFGEWPETARVTFTVKGESLPSNIPMIDKVEDLVAGKYYMCGYLESYTNTSNNTTTTFAPYSYHGWTGALNDASGNVDLVTVNYEYNAAAGTLTLNPNLSAQDAAKGHAQAITLEEVAGKENTYYIIYNGQYLYSTAAENRKLALSSTPQEWVFTNFEKGGILATNGGASLTSADATYNIIRSYKSPSSRSYGIVFFTESLVTLSGDPGDIEQPEVPTDYTVATIAQFNEAAVSTSIVYELTGTVSNITSTQYGNFDLTDETASVYVYGLSSNPQVVGDKTDQTFSSMGIAAGDKIKIRGYRGDYNGKIEVLNAWLIQIVEKGSGSTDPTPTPGGDGVFESDGIFVCSADDSGNSVYSLKNSTVNGEAADGFKLGTASKTGKFTSGAVGVTGDRTLTLYGFAWKGQKGTLKVSVQGGGSVDGTASYDLNSNDGASGNAPYTITGVTENDKYTFKLKGLTATSTIVFETESGAYRAVVAGVRLSE